MGWAGSPLVGSMCTWGGSCSLIEEMCLCQRYQVLRVIMGRTWRPAGDVTFVEDLGVESQRRLAHLLVHICQERAMYQGGVVVHPVHHASESADGGDRRLPRYPPLAYSERRTQPYSRPGLPLSLYPQPL